MFHSIKLTKIPKQWNGISDSFRFVSLHSIPLGSIPLRYVLVHQSKHGITCHKLFLGLDEFKMLCFGSSYRLGKLKKGPLSSKSLCQKIYFPIPHLRMSWLWHLGKWFWSRFGPIISLSFNREKNEKWRILKTLERFGTFCLFDFILKFYISIAFVNCNVIL